MARREYSWRPKCAEEGCREHAYYVFTTRSEERQEHERLARRGGWRCSRHDRPEEVLRPDNSYIRHVLVVTELFHEVSGKSLGLFWVPEGQTSGSGFTFGPGFKAHASDFAEGARLVVQARIGAPDA